MNELFEPQVRLFIERVQAVYSDFHINSARRLGSGQNNDVIAVNDEWIFRFPHHELGAANLNNEATLLRSLKGQLPLQIPFPEYVHIVPENVSRSFIGYRRIAGKPLTREWAEGLDDGELKMVAKQLVDFLRALHAQVIPKEAANGSTFEYWSDMFKRIQRLLFPHMRPEACEQVSRHFESFLREAADFNTALIHGDFGTDNILVDMDRSNKAVAVIDFGSVGAGDPAVDYAAASTIHPRMLEWMAIHHPAVRDYSHRIRFYKGTFALQEALYGAEAAFRSGLEPFV